MSELPAQPSAEPETEVTPLILVPDREETEAIEEDLLVEEVSIDGMCGVY